MEAIMKHEASQADLAFRKEVESCDFNVAGFNHEAHLRLAYIYLLENPIDEAVERMRATISGLLEEMNIDIHEKYHATLTRAWLLAVHHFMQTSGASRSAQEFLQLNPGLLDTEVMMTHYSSGRLFSDQARKSFLEPDLDPIPLYSTRSQRGISR